jgi:type III pantothenate kinase
MSQRHLGGEWLMVGPSVRTGMPIQVDNPHELGADRLVNAVAAYDRVGGACVAVDFGTSTNFDVVSAAGEYLGGVIGPGVEISMEALTERTAKLPRIDLSEPGRAIGKNTQEAIQAGVVHGFAGLVDGIAGRVAAELGDSARVIATGGLAPAIVPFCATIDEVDDLLTLTGLRLIYDRNR